MYSVVFESVAFDDISEAKQYYRKVSDQLAEKFQLAIAECSVDLQKNPYLFQKRIGESRFHKVIGFPFVLVYVIEEETVIVDAVYCTKKDTVALLKRL